MVDKSILTGNDKDRYFKQILIPSIREEGQIKLKQASVAVIGAGGLGSPVLQYLCAAGIGNIGIVDFDELQTSNLNRQTLYKPQEVGQNKAILAASWLSTFNPHIKVDPIPVRLETANIQPLLDPYPVLVDASDNFPTRYILSDYAFHTGKPLFFGAVNGLTGICTTFFPGETGCLRCIYPKEPSEHYQTQEKNLGIIGFNPGTIGSLLAGNVIKFLLQKGNYLKNKLLTIDFLENTFQEFGFKINPDCPLHRR